MEPTHDKHAATCKECGRLDFERRTALLRAAWYRDLLSDLHDILQDGERPAQSSLDMIRCMFRDLEVTAW